MAVTVPAPPAAPQRPTGTPDAVPERSPASPVTQGLAVASVLVVLAALASALEEPEAFVLPTAALASGLAAGLLVDLRRWFRTLPGAVWALGVMTGLVATAMALAWAGSPPPADLVWGVPLAGLVVLGLDWAWAERVRAVAVASGTVLLPLVADPSAPGLAIGMVWFGTVAATLWSARRDVHRALPRPRLLPGLGTPPEPAPVRAVVGLVAAWVAAALLVGLLSLVVFRPDPPDLDLGGRDRTVAGSGRSGLDDPRWGSGGTGGVGSPGGPGGAGSGGTVGPGGSGGSGGRVGPGQDGAGGPGARGGTGQDGREGTGAGAGAGSGAEDGSGRPGDPRRGDGDGDGDGIDLAAAVGILLAVAALAVVALVVARAVARARERRRERAARPWAVRLAERLEVEGRRRGRPRSGSEPVTRYAEALAADVLPDPRVVEVGRAVSASLFGPHGVHDGVGPWAEGVVDEVVAAHPVPRRWSRDGRGRTGAPRPRAL